jgi:hypothetical protein
VVQAMVTFLLSGDIVVNGDSGIVRSHHVNNFPAIFLR